MSEKTNKDSLPLAGIRVADFSRVLAGPYCSMLLADLGADVIKIERPDIGDETRSWGPPFIEDISTYYLSINRNKRSIGLNLKDENDLAKAKKIIAQSDVLLHNYKHGDDAKYGLDFDSVKALNPEIIYANISAFGDNGPEAGKPGYDLLAQAMTGFMSITGSPDGDGYRVGVAIIDILAGLNTAIGILASLYTQEDKGKKARAVETSLFEAGLASLVNITSAHLLTKRDAKRYGNEHPSIVPYQQFNAADAPFVIAAANNGQFARLAIALGKDEWLEDNRFLQNHDRVAHRDVLIPMIQEIASQQQRKDILENLQAHGVPCAPVSTVAEVFQSEQVTARDMLLNCEHPTLGKMPIVANAFKLDKQATPVYRHPPLLAEHQEEIEKEFNL